MSVFYKHLEILKNTQELAFFRRGTLDSKDNVEGFVKDFIYSGLEVGLGVECKLCVNHQVLEPRWHHFSTRPTSTRVLPEAGIFGLRV